VRSLSATDQAGQRRSRRVSWSFTGTGSDAGRPPAPPSRAEPSRAAPRRAAPRRAV